MKYTVSKEADKKIEENMKVIKRIIINRFNPLAIILFGGFGHGGGSFKKLGGKIIPLNDYDFYIITKKKISDDLLEQVGEECSKAIGMGGVEFVENFNKEYDPTQF